MEIEIQELTYLDSKGHQTSRYKPYMVERCRFLFWWFKIHYCIIRRHGSEDQFMTGDSAGIFGSEEFKTPEEARALAEKYLAWRAIEVKRTEFGTKRKVAFRYEIDAHETGSTVTITLQEKP